MSGAKWTPGPWRAEGFADRVNVWSISHKKHDASAVAYDMSPADARLIAAAPELYEALQALFDDHEDSGAWQAARAALAKARGES